MNGSALPLTILAIVALILFGKPLLRLFKRKPKEEKPEQDFSTLLFGEHSENLLENMKKQLKKANEEIAAISTEGKKLVDEEKELKRYIHEQESSIKLRKNELGARHGTWTFQKEMIQKMIDTQVEMERKLKEGKK